MEGWGFEPGLTQSTLNHQATALLLCRDELRTVGTQRTAWGVWEREDRLRKTSWRRRPWSWDLIFRKTHCGDSESLLYGECRWWVAKCVEACEKFPESGIWVRSYFFHLLIMILGLLFNFSVSVSSSVKLGRNTQCCWHMIHVRYHFTRLKY